MPLRGDIDRGGPVIMPGAGQEEEENALRVSEARRTSGDAAGTF
jgi:hypothetical protein